MSIAETHARITAEREEAQLAYRQRMPHTGERTMTNADRRAYEECAKIAEAEAADSWGHTERQSAAQAIAASIRAALPPREEDKPMSMDLCGNG